MVARALNPLVVFAVAVASCSAESQAAPDDAFDEIASRPLPTATETGQPVGSVTLPDVSQDGVSFSMQADSGELLVVYFGFTSCPDVCPTTLADLKTALETIGNDAASVEVAMVTVDPERDTAAVLVDYVQWFIPDAHALRSENQAELDAAGDAFGADFSVIETGDNGVEVLHTAYLYGVDDSGQVVMIWAFGTESDAIAADISAFLAG
jgi:protein SCO1/2